MPISLVVNDKLIGKLSDLHASLDMALSQGGDIERIGLEIKSLENRIISLNRIVSLNTLDLSIFDLDNRSEELLYHVCERIMKLYFYDQKNSPVYSLYQILLKRLDIIEQTSLENLNDSLTGINSEIVTNPIYEKLVDIIANQNDGHVQNIIDSLYQEFGWKKPETQQRSSSHSAIPFQAQIQQSQPARAINISAQDLEKSPRLVRFLLLQAMLNPSLNIKERVKLRTKLIALVKANQGGNQEDAAEMFIDPILNIIYQTPPILNQEEIQGIEDNEIHASPKDFLNKIELSLTKGATVAQIIASSLEGEVMDQENQFEKADGTKIDAIKTGRFISKENEITIALKRFTYEANRAIKKDDEIVLDNINIQQNVESPETHEYEATSFIVHTGGVAGGHYVAAVKDKEGFFLYNDDRIFSLTEQQFKELGKKAYIVKYSKVGLELPDHQTFGTTNFDGLNNACWANASMAFMLSFEDSRKKLLSEFQNNKLNGEEIRLLEQLDYQAQKIADDNEQKMQELAQYVQTLNLSQAPAQASQTIVKPTPRKTRKKVSKETNLQTITEESEEKVASDFIFLQNSKYNIESLYKTPKDDVIVLIKLDDDGQELEAESDNFDEFFEVFTEQMDVELLNDEYDENLPECNDSIINCFCPTPCNFITQDEISKLGKTKRTENRFNQFFGYMLEFYGLSLNENNLIDYLDDAVRNNRAYWKEEDATTNHTRFIKIISSAVYFGYYDKANALYKFLQKEIDGANPTIRMSDETKKELGENNAAIKILKEKYPDLELIKEKPKTNPSHPFTTNGQKTEREEFI